MALALRAVTDKMVAGADLAAVPIG